MRCVVPRAAPLVTATDTPASQDHEKSFRSDQAVPTGRLRLN